MRRLTVHLKKVKKERNNAGKEFIRNTLSFNVKEDAEINQIVSDLNNNNNVAKWYVSNIK
jgi:uncharacterized membrane protein YhiD involved in acid resistance